MCGGTDNIRTLAKIARVCWIINGRPTEGLMSYSSRQLNKLLFSFMNRSIAFDNSQSENKYCCRQSTQKHTKKRLRAVERFITKKVIAIAVSDVFVSLAITRSRLNLRFPCPNFPSIEFRTSSSFRACFFCSGLRWAGGLPNGGPLILMPLSLHQARFSLVR
jgi:hypothetical protein